MSHAEPDFCRITRETCFCKGPASSVCSAPVINRLVKSIKMAADNLEKVLWLPVKPRKSVLTSLTSLCLRLLYIYDTSIRCQYYCILDVSSDSQNLKFRRIGEGETGSFLWKLPWWRALPPFLKENVFLGNNYHFEEHTSVLVSILSCAAI